MRLLNVKVLASSENIIMMPERGQRCEFYAVVSSCEVTYLMSTRRRTYLLQREDQLCSSLARQSEDEPRVVFKDRNVNRVLALITAAMTAS